MKNPLLIFLLLFVQISKVYVQENYNLDFISNVNYGNLSGSDVWGFVTEDGTEYAIMGVETGVSIVSLADPNNPVEVEFIPGVTSIWREMASHKNFAYCIADRGTEGLLVIDMSKAPEEITWKFWNENITTNTSNKKLDRCHNIYVDPATEILYASGCNSHANGGVLMFDIKDDPTNPVYIAPITYQYAHDVFARGNTVYASEIYNGEFTVYDISDRLNPVFLGSAETSLSFTHNVWPSDDNKYIFSTDERAGSKIDAFDISDPTNIKFLSSFQPEDIKGDGVSIPHNAHYINGFLVVSWYTSGCIIMDVHDPTNMIQVGAYDTYDGLNGGFYGSWGAYPWLPSGNILVSDMNTGLYVLSPDYVRASYLSGLTRDITTKNPINDVQVHIVSEHLNDARTNFNGEFKTGIRFSGKFEVTFSHPDYLPKTIEVDLVSGEYTNVEVELIPLTHEFSAFVVVLDEMENPIPNAQVRIQDADNDITSETDQTGSTIVRLGTESNYNFANIGYWGYLNMYIDNFATYFPFDTTLQLSFGYEDNFEVDLGWDSEVLYRNDEYSGILLSLELDTKTDPTIYYTDNLDAKDGILSSPSFDVTGLQNPIINFSYAFVASSSTTSPIAEFGLIYNDELIPIQNLSTSNEWVLMDSLRIDAYVQNYDENLRFYIKLSGVEDCVCEYEFAFDNFKISPSDLTSSKHLLELADVKIFPNPGDGQLQLTIDKPHNYEDITIFSTSGIQVYKSKNISSTMNIDLTSLVPASYMIVLKEKHTGRSGALKYLIQK